MNLYHSYTVYFNEIAIKASRFHLGYYLILGSGGMGVKLSRAGDGQSSSGGQICYGPILCMFYLVFF